MVLRKAFLKWLLWFAGVAVAMAYLAPVSVTADSFVRVARGFFWVALMFTAPILPILYLVELGRFRRSNKLKHDLEKGLESSIENIGEDKVIYAYEPKKITLLLYSIFLGVIVSALLYAAVSYDRSLSLFSSIELNYVQARFLHCLLGLFSLWPFILCVRATYLSFINNRTVIVKDEFIIAPKNLYSSAQTKFSFMQIRRVNIFGEGLGTRLDIETVNEKLKIPLLAVKDRESFFQLAYLAQLKVSEVKR